MVDVLGFNDEAIRLESSGLTLLFMHFHHPCCCTDTSTMQDMAFAVAILVVTAIAAIRMCCDVMLSLMLHIHAPWKSMLCMCRARPILVCNG